MACSTSCKLCSRLILSTAINFDSTSGELIIAIPAGAYVNGQKYCLVLAQSLPATTTVDAPVVITVGDGTTRYPFTDCTGAQAAAKCISTRTRYATRAVTSTSGTGSFQLQGRFRCNCKSTPAAIT